MDSEKKEIKEIEQRDKLLEQFVQPYFDDEPDIEKDKFIARAKLINIYLSSIIKKANRLNI